MENSRDVALAAGMAILVAKATSQEPSGLSRRLKPRMAKPRPILKCSPVLLAHCFYGRFDLKVARAADYVQRAEGKRLAFCEDGDTLQKCLPNDGVFRADA